ncbi:MULTISPECIES: DUF6214 family protein [unclassified Streptomyces]|uniref:DUF6214 family protein n=1 Tax=unclassified Streptomyces TaxID=2593676 RepID=UPI00381F206A
MSEHRLMSAQEPPDRDAREWPVWEVQGHGTVTAVGDPRDGAERREILPPWVDVRLTFQDGARIDVLAVVRDGRIAIEDAQADPPLALDGFAALADAIEAPLQSACQVVAGPHRPPVPQPAAAVPCETLPDVVEAMDAVEVGTPPEEPRVTPGSGAGPGSGADLATGPGPGPGPDLGFGPVVDPATDPAPDPDPHPGSAPRPGCGTRPEPQAVTEPGPAPAVAAPGAASEGPSGGEERAPAESGRHRARTSVPRGGAARRGVAEIYRAAQSAGQDPVLAVMSATGFSRRKALRLIAGARDDGHLSPRHHRR